MSQPINILLVDDEPRNLDSLEAILEDPGYRLLRAVDADAALKLLLENDIAAIVLDIKMPGISGFELARLIKGTKKFRQIPIVFLTAYLVDDQDVVAGYGAGAVDYLTKPVNSQILRHKVAVFADLFRKTRALAELNEHLESRVQERTAELEKSEAALRTANLEKDRFLATLAHELRNPLAPLRTGLDLLLGQPDARTSERALAAMNRQLDHMVRLIDDLLDVSRISRGTLELRKEQVDLNNVVERAVEIANVSFVRRKQTLTVHAASQVRAFVDPIRIAQVVDNLLQNASKNSAAGASVRLELREQDGMATIAVVDEGAGIPPDQIARLFDMFTKIERSGQGTNDGLGIGLALSKRLAELHDGKIVAESAGEGKGATFTLCIPTGPVAPAVVKVERAPRSGTQSSLEIVVVEDNEDLAEMTTSWLEQLGHTVHVAHTGEAGVARARELCPDVVICDLGLPDIDGVEVCRRVLSSLTQPHPVMIAMTGWGMDQDRARTSEVGFVHHLVKPVDPDKLRLVLASIAQSRSTPARGHVESSGALK